MVAFSFILLANYLLCTLLCLQHVQGCLSLVSIQKLNVTFGGRLCLRQDIYVRTVTGYNSV